MTWAQWKKFAKKHRFLPITKQVLLAFAEGILLPFEMNEAFLFDRSAFVRGGLSYVRLRRREREAFRLRNALYTLKRRQFITTRKKGDQLLFHLTDKGASTVLHLQCRRAPLCAGGTSVIVIFDIPEQERRVRQQLRLFLRSCEFRLLQRSVWLCDREVTVLLQRFIRDVGAEQWVKIFRVSQERIFL